MSPDSCSNTLTLELVASSPGALRNWRAIAADTPRLARRLNRSGFNRKAGFNIFGRRGNDVIEVRRRNSILRGGRGNDQLTRGARRDLLLGSQGDDILNGSGGKNILVGGAGDDPLISGADRDMFSYRSVNHGVDLIRGFQVGVDVIDLRVIFRTAAFQVQGQTRYQCLNQFVRLVESSGNTQVQIDANGKGAGQVFNTLAVLEGISANQLSSCNFVV